MRTLLARTADDTRGHAVTREHFGHGIGLALREPGWLNANSDERFAAGEVYTVRMGLNEGSGAIVSAMVAVTPDGHDVLWRGAAS